MTPLAPTLESRPEESDDAIRSYEAVIDKDATITVADGEKTTSYAMRIIEGTARSMGIEVAG